MGAITLVVGIMQELLEGLVVVLMVLLLEELVHLVKDLVEALAIAIMELEEVAVLLELERMLSMITVAVQVEQDFNVILTGIMIIMLEAVVAEDITTPPPMAVMEVSEVEVVEGCILVLVLEVEEVVRGMIIVEGTVL